MQIIKRTDSDSYGANDVVAIVPDSHQFSSMELDINRFTIESIPDLTDAEISLLLMTDDGPSNFSAISQLPTFRSLSTGVRNTHLFHKRKYEYVNGGIRYNSQAQVRNG